MRSAPPNHPDPKPYLSKTLGIWPQAFPLRLQQLIMLLSPQDPAFLGPHCTRLHPWLPGLPIPACASGGLNSL